MKKGMSIRTKLMFFFALILTITVGVTFFAFISAGRITLSTTVRNYLISTVKENVSKISLYKNKEDVDGVYWIPFAKGYLAVDKDFLDVVSQVHVGLYSEDGVLLYGENPLPRATEDLSFRDSRIYQLEVGSVHYQLYDRKVMMGEEVLFIRGIASEEESETQLIGIVRTSLLILPLMILIAIMTGSFLVDKLLSPLRNMEQTAGQILQAEDLKVRLPQSKRRDEVGRLAQAFNQMLDRLETVFEKERQFTSDASHELRTPTAVMLAQADYTLEKPRSQEEYIEALEVVQRQGRRMRQLIGDMLDYTRLDQQEERYPFEEVDLSDTARDICEAMAVLEEKGITLTYAIEDGLTVYGNRLLLGRLLQNLIANAYTYGKAGGRTEVRLSGRENKIRLSVQDDGVGIRKEDQEKIFDRFYRSDASRTEKGTGLGLSMVKKIADLHGAKISVESEPGKGSCFQLIFEKK